MYLKFSGKHGAYDPIIQLININLQQNTSPIGAADVRQKYYLQLAEMADFVLSGKKAHYESIKDAEKRKLLLQKFETFRHEQIAPFVEADQFELATKLAEKYLDFQTLVLIADRTNQPGRLEEYKEKFKNHDFSQFAINWHLRHNKQSTIFSRFQHDQAALGQFLSDHPSLAWIQFFQNGEFARASQILFALAQNEKDLIARKKTMLSMAKLSALASQSGVDVNEINAELVLVQHQEQLPKELLHNFGYDVENPKVLAPEEIIHVRTNFKKKFSISSFKLTFPLYI